MRYLPLLRCGLVGCVPPCPMLGCPHNLFLFSPRRAASTARSSSRSPPCPTERPFWACTPLRGRTLHPPPLCALSPRLPLGTQEPILRPWQPRWVTDPVRRSQRVFDCHSGRPGLGFQDFRVLGFRLGCVAEPSSPGHSARLNKGCRGVCGGRSCRTGSLGKVRGCCK